MPEYPTSQRIRFRRDTPSEWLRHNPVLKEGEPGYERGTGKMKVGDGVTPWSELDYFVVDIPTTEAPGSSDPAVAAHINDPTPHPVYDEGPSFLLFYNNQKV